jgi:hypothetical protein
MVRWRPAQDDRQADDQERDAKWQAEGKEPNVPTVAGNERDHRQQREQRGPDPG